MATHELHHKIDEVVRLLRSVEDTTKRAKALLDQTTMKNLEEKKLKSFFYQKLLKNSHLKNLKKNS